MLIIVLLIPVFVPERKYWSCTVLDKFYNYNSTRLTLINLAFAGKKVELSVYNLGDLGNGFLSVDG